MTYEQFIELQAALIALWSETPEVDLEALFTDAVAESHRALMASGYKDAANDHAVVASHLDMLKSDPETDGWANAFLIASLHERAHRLPPMPNPESVPSWLRDVFWEFQFATPILFLYGGEAEAYIDHLERWFSILLADIEGKDGPVLRSAHAAAERVHAHVFCYFSDRSIRDVMRNARRFQAYRIEQDGHVLAYDFPKKSRTARRRLGLYRDCWSGTELLFVLPILRHLDRSSFEIVLFADQTDGSDEEKLCRGYADTFVELPEDLSQAVSKIRSFDMDLLVVATFLGQARDRRVQLAMHRLARRQATYFTSPATSGMPHMDNFLTTSVLDPQAVDDYVECPAFLPSPGLCFDRDYFAELWQPQALTRADIGVEDEDILFICTGSLAKISFSQRYCWYAILKRLPQARVLVTPFSEAGMQLNQDVVQRAIVSELAGEGLDGTRVIVSDARGSDSIRAHVRLADVFLNTFPFGGSVSLVENLLFGPPPVVMRGRRLASRMAEVIMEELGLDDMIADDTEAFVDLACRLGGDIAFHEFSRVRIDAALARPSRIFDMSQFSEGVNRVLLDLTH